MKRKDYETMFNLLNLHVHSRISLYAVSSTCIGGGKGGLETEFKHIILVIMQNKQG